ncbi:MAG: hypothetical protein KAR83_00475 [Thermodesulfovibrionales bacterium]|nr:hypothetical protein [Thermodesulfovibrionales bacterium]
MKKLTIVLAVLLSFSFIIQEASGRTFVTIGTGGVTGVYYPTGGAIISGHEHQSGGFLKDIVR